MFYEFKWFDIVLITLKGHESFFNQTKNKKCLINILNKIFQLNDFYFADFEFLYSISITSLDPVGLLFKLKAYLNEGHFWKVFEFFFANYTNFF